MTWERFGTLIAAVVLSTTAVFTVSVIVSGFWLILSELWKSTLSGA